MQNKIKQLVDAAQTIVIIQADNPDADSLGSSLALEQILGEMGKHVTMYCGIDVPRYLSYLDGWDRVTNELPVKFDLSIIVDASTLSLLDQLANSPEISLVKSKPCVVLDHHETTDNSIDFAAVSLIDTVVSSTAELIFNLAQSSDWPIDKFSGEHIMASILGDTQGLINDLAKASTYQVMAQLVELGVNRPTLEEKRRQESKMAEKIFRYKAELIKRTELFATSQRSVAQSSTSSEASGAVIATVTIPQAEINEYSPLYNPAVLVQFEMLQVKNVLVSIVFKTYDSGRLTAKIRCNTAAPIAGQLAAHFGGGGHDYAAGFRVDQTHDFNKLKNDCIAKAAELLAKL